MYDLLSAFHEGIRGSLGMAPPLLTSTLDRVNGQLQVLATLVPAKTTLQTEREAGRTCLDVMEKRNICNRCPDIKRRFHRRPARSQLTVQTELSRVMEQSYSWEPSSSSGPFDLGKTKCYYPFDNRLPTVPSPSQINPLHSFRLYLFTFHSSLLKQKKIRHSKWNIWRVYL